MPAVLRAAGATSCADPTSCFFKVLALKDTQSGKAGGAELVLRQLILDLWEYPVTDLSLGILFGFDYFIAFGRPSLMH